MNLLQKLRFIYAKNKILKAIKENNDYIVMPKPISEMTLKEKIRYVFFINPEPVKLSCKDYLLKIMQNNNLNYHDVAKLCDVNLLKLLQGSSITKTDD